jgi:hypothetical protein
MDLLLVVHQNVVNIVLSLAIVPSSYYYSRLVWIWFWFIPTGIKPKLGAAVSLLMPQFYRELLLLHTINAAFILVSASFNIILIVHSVEYSFTIIV